jgi:hypothetical protein
MSIQYWLTFILQSEACFARGDGVPGVVDIEVNHDRNGLPFLSGRTLKGLLHADASEIVAALRRSDSTLYQKWAEVANTLFGQPGSLRDKEGCLHVGDARLPADLRSQVVANFDKLGLHRHDVLETLTTIRRQTAVDSETGAPKKDTLRAVRVILRQTTFVAPLILRGNWNDKAERQDVLAFLAACTKAFRRAGSNKTRGYGLLAADLRDTEFGPAVTDTLFKSFKEALQ